MDRPTQVPGSEVCEEASMMSHSFYIPCGRPASGQVYFDKHKEGPYWMCDMCMDHNLRNRGAVMWTPPA